MYKKLDKFITVSLLTIVIGILSINVFGQNNYQIKQKIDYYENLEQRWVKYRNESVLPYYNNPKYSRWAQNEYKKATQQILAAQKYKAYYQSKYVESKYVESKYLKPGTETITQECWVKAKSTQCTMIYGQIFWYDDGTVNRSDYDNKRNQMVKAGYSFKWAKEYSSKRFGKKYD